jgi:hypothetical protein
VGIVVGYEVEVEVEIEDEAAKGEKGVVAAAAAVCGDTWGPSRPGGRKMAGRGIAARRAG